MATTDSLTFEQRLADARAFALQWHGDQMYGERPYSYHLDQVAELAARYNLSRAARLAAYLHDTYEDTGLTRAELTARYGQDVDAFVWAVTGEGEAREEQSASIVAKLKAFLEAIDLKLVDRLANVAASVAEGKTRLVDRYRSEMKYYDPLFRQGNPEAYAELCRLLAQ